MKLLRNPMAVGVLAVLAAVIVGVQLWPLLHRPGPPPRAATIPAPEPISQPVAPVPPPQKKNPPESSIDVAALEARASAWTKSPKKDPFLSRKNTIKPTAPRARELLTLNAVWRQTQGDLAVINNLIVAEGDQVLKFKIARIEPDGVWVDGPNGREQIVFASATPVSADAAQPAAQARP